MVKEPYLEIDRLVGSNLLQSEGLTLMGTSMNEIEKHAAFYRAYLADDRSLASVAGLLMIAIALWLFIYLVSLVGPAVGPGSDRQAARPGVSLDHAAVQRADP